MSSVCSSLPFVPEGEKCLAVCMHWTFLRHVLPSSSSVEALKEFAHQYQLFDIADRFAAQLIERLDNKEELVKYLFDSFPGIPRKRAALQYLQSRAGYFQKTIL